MLPHYPASLLHRRDHRGVAAEAERRLHSLAISRKIEFRPRSSNSVMCLSLNAEDERFMLAGGLDGSVQLFDLERRRPANTPLDPIATAKKARLGEFTRIGAMAGHRYSVSSVQWYPVDNGLFLSTGMHGNVICWDTNRFAPALAFPAVGVAYTARMSPLGQHTLVAIGGDDSAVRLCDLSSGSSSHVLVGHRAQVLAAEWSPSDPYSLATGSADHTVRVWDVRRSGATACVATLDMHAQSNAIQDAGETLDLSAGADFHDAAALASTTPAAQLRVANARPRKRQRVSGPHRSAAASLVAAHGGRVTALRFLHGGRFLLSSGTDGCMRLWRAKACGGFENTFVHYAGVVNEAQRGTTLAVAECGSVYKSVVFHPQWGEKRADVAAFDIHSGRALRRLEGHLDTVNCAVFRSSVQELYTAAVDGLMLAWESARGDENSGRGARGREAVGAENNSATDDAWSDDEER